jgi:hypothetical protein
LTDHPAEQRSRRPWRLKLTNDRIPAIHEITKQPERNRDSATARDKGKIGPIGRGSAAQDAVAFGQANRLEFRGYDAHPAEDSEQGNQESARGLQRRVHDRDPQASRGAGCLKRCYRAVYRRIRTLRHGEQENGQDAENGQNSQFGSGSARIHRSAAIIIAEGLPCLKAFCNRGYSNLWPWASLIPLEALIRRGLRPVFSVGS